MHGAGGFTMVLVWVLLILGIVYLWRVLDLGRSFREGARPDRTGDPARDIVRRRYAAGEIDEETFERLIRDLG